MKILVTGTRGFIGSNMANYLEDKGHSVIRFDIKDNDRLPPSLKKVNAVIHMGAISDTREKDWAKVIQYNTDYTQALMNLCALHKIKFQYSSSASVYGAGRDFSETAFCQPLNPYGTSKLLCDVYASQFHYPVQGFRYFNVYGRGEECKRETASPVSKFTWQAEETGTIKLFEGSGQFLRDFVCVEDVCQIHEKMLRSHASGVFNVGTGRAVSFQTVADKVAERTGAKIEYIPMPQILRGQYQEFTKADNSKLNKLFPRFEWTQVEDWIHGN